MIAKDNMMGVLVEACPSFAPQWEEFQEEWREKADDMPLYMAMADFARHLIGMVERGEMAGLPSVFAAVERLHEEGERYVREAATVGLLEDLQNVNLHKNGTVPEKFRPYLGPKSTLWWNKLDRFWQNKELLSDE